MRVIYFNEYILIQFPFGTTQVQVCHPQSKITIGTFQTLPVPAGVYLHMFTMVLLINYLRSLMKPSHITDLDS